MRHLVGVMLAIVMAAALFFAASWGYLKLLIGPAGLGRLPGGGGTLLHDHAVLEGFGALLGVSLLADWTQTKPQQQAEPGNPSPPSSSQAPWGPAEYS